MLAAFVVLGGLAVVAVYLFDQNSLQDDGRRIVISLIGLVILEGLVSLTFAADGDWVAAAAAAGVGVWGVCVTVPAYKSLWCAVAIFVSVPVLGATVGIAHSFDEPQVQPVAIVGKHGEALQGIYITENDERVYLATLLASVSVPRSATDSSVPRLEYFGHAVQPEFGHLHPGEDRLQRR